MGRLVYFVLRTVTRVTVIFSVLAICAAQDNVEHDSYSQRATEVQTVQICTVCKCSEVESVGEDPQVQSLQIVCNEVSVNVDQFPGLDRLQWPTYDYSQISVKFEAIGLTAIQRIPANQYVEHLSFEGNSVSIILPAAFSALENLSVLSLAHNNLAEITPDIFINLALLVELDLSFNKLTDFNVLQFEELKSLKKLILKSNLLPKVPLWTLAKIQNLEYLDLSENQIFYADFSDPSAELYILSNVKYLDLNHNQISMLRKETFDKAENLQYIDVSSNGVQYIDEDVFTGCPNLIEINLSYNEISSLFDLPQNVQVLRISENKLYKWPNLPSRAKLLDISFNDLVSAENLILLPLDDLEVLNVSGNQINEFEIPQKCPNLRVLDISYNSITTLPSSLNSDFLPLLDELKLDGNPLSKLHFSKPLILKRLFANQLNEITDLEENALANIIPRADGQLNADEKQKITDDDVQELKSTECIDLSISHCSKLSNIHELAFSSIPICQLDISYNNLTTISKSIANWSYMTNGINLQGNPWDCECHLQWILDELLQELYVSHPTLLHELRCETPRYLMGLRLVHWYNWGQGALCQETNSKKTENYVIMETNEAQPGFNLVMGSSTIFITVLVCLLIGIVAVIVLIVYVVRGKNQHNYQVRQAMKRRRQTLEDRKKDNSEQFSALNKV